MWSHQLPFCTWQTALLYGTSLKSHHFVNSLYFHMSIFRPGGLERDYELPKILHHITTIEPYQLERIPITYRVINNSCLFIDASKSL